MNYNEELQNAWNAILDFSKAENNDNEELMKNFAALIAMPDEDFEIIAPSILDNFAQMVNDEKILLTGFLKSTGGSSQDLLTHIETFYEEIDKITVVSEAKKDFLKAIAATIYNAVNEVEKKSKKIIQIPFERCSKDAKIPEYAHDSDSGMDVYALDDYIIAPGETKLIPTGIKMAIPTGYEIQVRPKSGRALKTKLRVANTPGTIDSGYRDEICVIVENIEAPIKNIHYEFNEDMTPKIIAIDHGTSYSIGKGEKFAQLVLVEIGKVALYEVSSVSNIGEDRNGGFGSTGLK